MVYNEHQLEDSLAQGHFNAQDNLPAISLDAARTWLTKLLSSRTPHERQIAADAMDRHVLIIERWVHEGGESANTIRAEITKMKVQRNAFLPIHALPSEILTCIFLICLKPITWSIDDIFRLMSVCSSWKRFLKSGALFWPKLHTKYSLPTLELVLRRNPSGPLRVVCSKQEEADAKSGLLELAAEHSTRWCNLTFKGIVCNAVKEKLQVHTPNLTELYVFNSSSLQIWDATLGLSEGRLLRHVLLCRVAIPWDTSRLRGLRSLQLSKVSHNSPSLAQLYTILASSPELWYLRLSGFTEPSEGAADMIGLPSDLLLPALSTLVLQAIPERFMVQLLTHIQAPVCSCIVAADIPFYAVTNPNFQNLITPALRISDGIRITSSGATLFIISQQRPQVILDWIDSVEETVGIQITIRRGVSGAASKEDIQSVLNTVMVHAPSKLTVAFIPSSSALPIMTAPELLRLLPSTKEIGCYRLFTCHDVLQYLVTDDGEGSGFPCPDLETLTLSPKDDTEVELLRNLLRRGLRQNPSQLSGCWSVRPLKGLFAPQSVLDMLNTEGLLEGLETDSL